MLNEISPNCNTRHCEWRPQSAMALSRLPQHAFSGHEGPSPNLRTSWDSHQSQFPTRLHLVDARSLKNQRWGWDRPNARPWSLPASSSTQPAFLHVELKIDGTRKQQVRIGSEERRREPEHRAFRAWVHTLQLQIRCKVEIYLISKGIC